MKRNLKACLAVALLSVALVPSPARAQGLGEILEGLTNPQLVAGASYNDASESKWSAVLTANILGPKLGTVPCYIAGAGVALNTIAPGLEEASIAAWSLPLLTCAPFGEAVVIQTGLATPLNGNGGKSYYVGVGFGVQSPNTLRAKRVKRAEAKAAKKAAELLLSHPTPATS